MEESGSAIRVVGFLLLFLLLFIFTINFFIRILGVRIIAEFCCFIYLVFLLFFDGFGCLSSGSRLLSISVCGTLAVLCPELRNLLSIAFCLCQLLLLCNSIEPILTFSEFYLYEIVCLSMLLFFSLLLSSLTSLSCLT